MTILTSCKDDEPDSDGLTEKLIGKWQRDQSDQLLVFNKDKSGYSYYNNSYDYFKDYKVENDRLYLLWEWSEDEYYGNDEDYSKIQFFDDDTFGLGEYDEKDQFYWCLYHRVG